MQLLVDYSSLLYRAYHSMPSTVPMHGTHGFLNMLARVVTDRRPDRLAVCTDDDWRPAFRVDALPSYKAHRVEDALNDPVTPHEQLGRQVLEAMGVCLPGSPGFEAEDVIATLAAKATEPVKVVSGDRDLFALVRDPDVVVLYPKRGVSELIEVDEAEITRRYSIPGRRYGDFALLRGDPSDGLPGVPGIGDKTAAQLVSKYGSLDALLEGRGVPPGLVKRLNAARDYLDAARRVVLPVEHVPLPELDLSLPSAPRDQETLEGIAKEHELDGPIDRLWAALTKHQ